MENCAFFAKINFAETFAHFLAMSGKVKSFPIVDGALISDTYPKSFLIPANKRCIGRIRKDIIFIPGGNAGILEPWCHPSWEWTLQEELKRSITIS